MKLYILITDSGRFWAQTVQAVKNKMEEYAREGISYRLYLRIVGRC